MADAPRPTSRGGSEASTPGGRRQDDGARFEEPTTPTSNDPGGLPALQRSTGRPTTPNAVARGTYRGLEAKVHAKVEDSRAIKDELERLYGEVRDAYQQTLRLLKEAELERIELQAEAHWLATTRRNWAEQHHFQGVQPSAALDARLAQEAQAAEAALTASDGSLRALTSQVARLRKARDALDMQLIERRRQLYIESTLLSHTSAALKGLEGRLTPSGAGAFRVPPIGQSARRPGSGSVTPSERSFF